MHVPVLAVQGLVACVERSGRGQRLSAALVTCLLTAPYWLFAGGALVEKAATGTTVSGTAAVSVSPTAFVAESGAAIAGAWPGGNLDWLGPAAWVVLALAGIAVGIARSRAAGRGPAWAAGLGLCGGVATAFYLASTWSSLALVGRYLLLAAPFAALAQGWAVRAALDARLRLGRARVALVGLSLVVAIIAISSAWGVVMIVRTQPMDWGALPDIAAVERDSRAGDLVVFTDHARLGLYTLRGRGRAPATSVHLAGSAFLREDARAVAPRATTPVLAGRDRVWLTREYWTDGASRLAILDAMGRDWYRTEIRESGGAVIELYVRRADTTPIPCASDFGATVTLERCSISVSPDAIAVELVWRSRAPLPADYKVFAHLLDAQGQGIAQHDGEPGLGLRPTSTWQPGQVIEDRFVIPLPQRAGAQPWRIDLGLYRGEERLRLSTGSDHVVLEPIAAPVR
jgi:hypothetical protein